MEVSKRLVATLRRAAFALLLLAVLLELALRLTGGVRLALRERAVADAAGAGSAVRILHVGESTTYGLGVDPEQAYPAVLAGLLAQRDPQGRFFSYNRGVPGLTSTAMLRSLDEKLEAVRPSVVVIMAGANDFNERLNGVWGPDDGWLPTPLRAAVEDLRLYRVARLALELSRPGVELRDGEILYFRHGASVNLLYDEARDELRIAQVTARLESNLERMIQSSREAGARVLLVGYIQSYEENRILERVAVGAGIPYVSTFIAPEHRTPDLFTEDGWHPSAAGHRHIAGRIAESLLHGDSVAAAAPAIP
jgi:lysophospholipase L1-like esterase